MTDDPRVDLSWADSDPDGPVTHPCRPALQAQAILFNNNLQDLQRAAIALARAVELAKGEGVFGAATLVWGDCSATPTLTDGEAENLTSELASRGVDSFRYEYFGENLGSAAGHNRLLSTRSDDYVLITNPDIIVAPDSLIELSLPMFRSGQVGIVEARQLPIEHPKAYDPVTGVTSWASTACVLIADAVLNEVGGFDEDSFFLYCDDVDFSWRARLAGYSVVYRPSARVFHDKRVAVGGGLAAGQAEVFYSAEAALMLAHKYSRPDLVARFKRDLLKEGNAVQRKAVKSFLEKELPIPIDADHRVAQFVAGNYAVHRF